MSNGLPIKIIEMWINDTIMEAGDAGDKKNKKDHIVKYSLHHFGVDRKSLKSKGID